MRRSQKQSLMVAKKGPEDQAAEFAPSKTGVYIDSSALAKLYTPEPESDTLDRYMQGRRDLKISEICITEVVSAVARRKREGGITAKQAGEIRKALYSDAQSGSFQRLDISPAIHRHAEQMLLSTESVALRTLDALHTSPLRWRWKHNSSSRSTVEWLVPPHYTDWKLSNSPEFRGSADYFTSYW